MQIATALKIRAATAADIPAMVALEKHAVTAAHWPRARYEEIFAALSRGEDTTHGAQPAKPLLSDRGVSAGCRCYGQVTGAVGREAVVIEEEGLVQGFLVARAVDEEWEIENIAVAGSARRRGLGTRLLGEFLDLAAREGAQAVYLEVRESNLAARALYEKWAFLESGRRPRYYRDPEEDAILYRLHLL